MIDGDGQNPPREIPRLMETLLENDYDMVCGYRRRRYNRMRALSSRIANGFRNLVTHDNIRDVGCSLRVFRAECIDGVYVFRGMHRFLPTLVRINGFDRIAQIPVDNEPRRRGRSKYGINNRLWVGLVDTFAVRWMRGRVVVPRVKRTSVDDAGAARKVEPGPIAVVSRGISTGEAGE
jgi:dolichol-phosphate mannosyltransferase